MRPRRAPWTRAQTPYSCVASGRPSAATPATPIARPGRPDAIRRASPTAGRRRATRRAPHVVNRDDKGRATLRATRIVRPLTIDGRLDEEVYVECVRRGRLHPAGAARERSRPPRSHAVWVFFDDKNLYVSARCYDSHPEREVATELRRDNSNIIQNENFTVVLDTFHDRRNGFLFQTNPLGAMRDQAVADGHAERRAGTPSGTCEAGARRRAGRPRWSIPFKSLRYRGIGTAGVGHQPPAGRQVEERRLAISRAVPASLRHQRRLPDGSSRRRWWAWKRRAQSMNLELKPYAGVVADDGSRARRVRTRTTSTSNAGFDFKYGLTAA